MSSEDTFEDYIDYLDLPSFIMNHFRTSTAAPSFALPEVPKKTKMSISVRPLGSPAAAAPSPSSPPSGRIPFPSHLADYSTPPPEIVPLDPGTLHYVSSSTLRPGSDQPSAKTREVVKMLKRVKVLLEQNRSTLRPTGSTQDVSAMLGRVRGLLASGRSPTLRPGGIRRYPSNPINSQLPVTSQPSPPPTPPPPCCLPASAPRPTFAPTLLLFIIALQWLH